MKKLMNILVLCALMTCIVPAQAQNAQEWQTSMMQTSGSAYAPQVTAVGATTVGEMATTTQSMAPAQAPTTSGPRKINPIQAPTPIGDALIPLMLMALGFGVYCAVRGRKERTPSK